MKRIGSSIVVALAVAALALPLVTHAKEGMAAGKSTMSQYLVISPHTPEQCVKALDDTQTMNGLTKWSFGCMDGDHTGYLIVNAHDAAEALRNVPADERAAARAVRLHHFSAAELKDIHQHMGAAK